MKKKLEIRIFDVKLDLPEPGETVLVNGGVARWNGVDWFSAIHDGCGQMRKIEWPVKWWADLIQIEDN